MLSWTIILTIGALTTFTDLKSKKISNQHLKLGAVLCLIATAYAAIFRHEHVLFHLVNGLVAFLIGFLMYRSELWRGGDAKLFTLYAFLMPVAVNNQLLFFNAISLFACSFIIGTIILLPAFIKDIIINHKAIVNNLLLPGWRQAFFEGTMKILYLSWVLFPCYYLVKIPSSVIILMFMSFFFAGYATKGKKHYITEFFKNDAILLSAGFIAGLLFRLWLSPDSLSYQNLAQYIFRVALSAFMSNFIYSTFNHFKGYLERVPFAPMLLIGCVLSYTPFLIWIMHLSRLINNR